MAKEPKATKPAKVPAFYLQVDGKQFGPFPVKQEAEIKRLYHYKGIAATYASVAPDKLIAPPKKAKRKVEQPDLLTSVQWEAVGKIRKCGWD